MNEQISKILKKYYGIYECTIENVESLFGQTYIIHISQNDKKYILRKIENKNDDETFKIIESKLFLKNILYEKILHIENDIYYLYDSKNYTIEHIKFEDILKYTEELQNKFLYEMHPNEIIKRWESKVDYIEKLLLEVKKQDEKVLYIFNYFVGMSEVSIKYFKEKVLKNELNSSLQCTIVHKRIGYIYKKIELNDPYNYILDNRVRDISEYVKDSLVRKNYTELNNELSTIKKIEYSSLEYGYLVSRIMFPTFFFDNIESYLYSEKDSCILFEMTKYVNKYESVVKHLLEH